MPMRSMRVREKYQALNVRAHALLVVSSIVALHTGSMSCGSGTSTEEPQDESPGAGGSAGSDGASGASNGDTSGTGGNITTGGEASDGGSPSATGGNSSAADGGGAGGSSN